MVADLLSLLGVLTLGLLSPGPDFFVVVKNSLGGSRARSLGTVGGVVLGVALQCLVLASGFAVAPPAVLRGVQWAGAAFLAYLGLRALLARSADAVAADPSPNAGDSAPGAAIANAVAGGAGGGFAEGLLCNVTNPKSFLFFLSLYAQLVRPEGGAFWKLVLPLAITLHAAVAWLIVALTVQSAPVSRHLRRAQRWLPRAFGAALLALAAWTAWSALR